MSEQRRVRVLIADDHAVVRAGLRTLMSSEDDIEVVAEAADGEEAVRLAASVRPDVVVLDISMPGSGGVAATERITKELPDVRVLALTMHDDRGHLKSMLDAGASGYVLKQSPREDLLRAVRAVSGGEPFVDPRLAGAVLRSSTPAADEDAAPLSGREAEVIRRIAWGESNKAIARSLDISVRTVETYKARIADKLGLRTRADIVRYAVKEGWMQDTRRHDN